MTPATPAPAAQVPPVRITFALDYDGTFTLDPLLWFRTIKLWRSQGHQVVIVTSRHDVLESAAEVRRAIASAFGVNTGIVPTWGGEVPAWSPPLVFAAGASKREALRAAGLPGYGGEAAPVIFIDDMPETVHPVPVLLAGTAPDLALTTLTTDPAANGGDSAPGEAHR